MSIDRWDPFRDMMTIREAMDRWLQQSLSGTGQLLSTLRPDSIPIDVVERDDSFEVRASVPGVKPEDVEVTVQGERVSIRAELRSSGEQQRGENWLMREHRYGVLQRAVTLPSAVSSENAEAKIEHGVLSLKLPKLQGAQARRIAVSTSSSSTGAQTVPHGSRDQTAEGDKVTEESQESFPASDPPSWTSAIVRVASTSTLQRNNDGLVRRIRAEFLEMPGLCLTNEQAQRLWSLEPRMCEAVLKSLIDSRFLRRTDRGLFVLRAPRA
jgi:HSP20 family protein